MLRYILRSPPLHRRHTLCFSVVAFHWKNSSLAVMTRMNTLPYFYHTARRKIRSGCHDDLINSSATPVLCKNYIITLETASQHPYPVRLHPLLYSTAARWCNGCSTVASQQEVPDLNPDWCNWSNLPDFYLQKHHETFSPFIINMIKIYQPKPALFYNLFTHTCVNSRIGEKSVEVKNKKCQLYHLYSTFLFRSS